LAENQLEFAGSYFWQRIY